MSECCAGGRYPLGLFGPSFSFLFECPLLGDEGRVFIADKCCFAKSNVVWHGAARGVVGDEDFPAAVEGDDLVERVVGSAATAVVGADAGAGGVDGAVDWDVRQGVNAGGDLLFGVAMGGRKEEDSVIEVDDRIVNDDGVGQGAVSPVTGPKL